jgi:hypothetical protein
MYFCADTDSDSYPPNPNTNIVANGVADIPATDIHTDCGTNSHAVTDLFTDHGADRGTNRRVVLCVAN